MKDHVVWFRKKSPKDKASEGKAVDYPTAYNENYDTDEGEPVWERYLKKKDRQSMRLPILAGNG